LLDVTTAMRSPLSLRSRTRATEDSKTCTPLVLSTSLNTAFLRFPIPHTVSLSGIPPLQDDAAVVARLAVHVAVIVRVYRERVEGAPLACRQLFEVIVESSLPSGSVHASRVGEDPVEVD
jgi:hypothetical protein